MISAGLEIHRADVDTIERDGSISPDEMEAYFNSHVDDLKDATSAKVNEVPITAQSEAELKKKIAEALMAKSGENVTSAEQARTALETEVLALHDYFNEAQAAQQALQQGGDSAKLEQAFKDAKARLQEQIKLVQQLNSSAGNDINKGIAAPIRELADMDGGTGAKATFAMNSGSGTGASSGVAAQTVGSGVIPNTWGASNAFDGMKAFSTSAYQNSVMNTDNILNSFDSVLKNQNQGKQLMMLFFYFARMAESGDMGAMYQFMKFITYIISKDKSKQQIDMGKKLIELQDLSRQWTDKLLNTQTDSTDPNASNEFTKTMMQVKSETDAIATSQKLISQMMEEFSQIVETLTNSTKTALQANGNILKTLSRPM